MQVDVGGRLDIGLQRIGVQEQDQLGALVELVGDRPLPHELLRVLHELGRKGRLIAGRGPWHRTPPRVDRTFVPLRFLSSLPATLSQPYSYF